MATSGASQSTPFPVANHVQTQNDSTPALPPQMASVRSHTADEIVQMLNRTPLFMTSLEDSDAAGTYEGNYLRGICSSQ